MEVSELFLKLLVILFAAKLFAEIFSRLSVPSVLGEVVAGLIIGPSVRLVMAQEAKEENLGNPNSQLDKQQSRESISVFLLKGAGHETIQEHPAGTRRKGVGGIGPEAGRSPGDS